MLSFAEVPGSDAGEANSPKHWGISGQSGSRLSSAIADFQLGASDVPNVSGRPPF